jgi:hypothetical protein
MAVKDYYRVLEIPHNARQEEIKKAYRKLAMRYHPDKNTGNPYAVQYFREIQEAYDVLSNPVKRSEYHQARGQFGSHSARNEPPVAPSADLIYQEALKIKKYVKQLDVFRMNQGALATQFEQLLNERHLSILLEAGRPVLTRDLVEVLLESMQPLRYSYWKSLIPSLIRLAGTNNQLLLEIRQAEKRKQREAAWDLYKPWILLLIVTLICVLIYIIA